MASLRDKEEGDDREGEEDEEEEGVEEAEAEEEEDEEEDKEEEEEEEEEEKEEEEEERRRVYSFMELTASGVGNKNAMEEEEEVSEGGGERRKMRDMELIDGIVINGGSSMKMTNGCSGPFGGGASIHNMMKGRHGAGIGEGIGES
ncbi:hypothetical protein V8C37DRAFT_403883 [Trichoderma ceciliae]